MEYNNNIIEIAATFDAEVKGFTDGLPYLTKDLEENISLGRDNFSTFKFLLYEPQPTY